MHPLLSALSLPGALAIMLPHAGRAAAQTPAAPTARSLAPTEKDLSRHLAFLASRDRLIASGGSDLVFVGDSITDGWRSDPQREIFENYFGRYRPYNIGVSGDETQHVLWRIEHGELDGLRPKLVVLMIGTNNLGNGSKMTPVETAVGVEGVVRAIRARLPTSRILLLDIFPRGNRADDPIRPMVAATNARLAWLQDGGHVRYKDISASFLAADGTLPGSVMPDYLHPNAAGYQRWADAIRADVDAMESGG